MDILFYLNASKPAKNKKGCPFEQPFTFSSCRRMPASLNTWGIAGQARNDVLSIITLPAPVHIMRMQQFMRQMSARFAEIVFDTFHA